MILVAALVVSVAVLAGVFLLGRALRAMREELARNRIGRLLETFHEAGPAAEQDPRAILAWEELARTTRRALPDEFAALDRAAGGRFPFDTARIQAAHARWTTDWLAWERTHDLEYKLKVLEHEASGSTDPAYTRTRVEAIEREKLDLYQQRYAEYVRVSKALQALF